MKSATRDARHPAFTSADKAVRTKRPVLWDETVMRQLLKFPCTRVMLPVRATIVGVGVRSIRVVENSVSPEHRGSLLDCSQEKDVHANFICHFVTDSHDSSVRLSLLWVDRKLRRRN